MIAKDYQLIRNITKELGLNDGKGFSKDYIIRVLSETDKRKNEEIEVIASVINEAVTATQDQLLKNFDSYKDGKAHWIRVCAKKLNEKQEAA